MMMNKRTEIANEVFDSMYDHLTEKGCAEATKRVMKLVDEYILDTLETIYHNAVYGEDRTAREVIARISTTINSIKKEIKPTQPQPTKQEKEE